MASLVTRLVTEAADLEEVRRLCREYRSFLLARSPAEARVVQIFYPEPIYKALLANLPRLHAPPDGAIKLAEFEGRAVGCGMLHRVGPDMAEIKRVYVRPAARGLGIGRALCVDLIRDARKAGYGRVVLDTSRTLVEARTLYERLGFVERAPFYDLPDAARDLLCFYELVLKGPRDP